MWRAFGLSTTSVRTTETVSTCDYFDCGAPITIDVPRDSIGLADLKR